MERRLKVAFCHPDLGLGGAERLIVDAASELASKEEVGRVDVWTAYYNKERSFQETHGSGGFSVRVAGNWFPRSLFGLATALCSYVRCCLVALSIVLGRAKYDVVIVDQVSVVIPIFLLLSSAKVIFYCHFPDQLLASPKTFLHRLYRAPLNWLEECTTGMAHKLLVNSEYTQGVFASTFRSLARRGLRPQVLHPAVAIPSEEDLAEAEASVCSRLDGDFQSFLSGGDAFLSINRFERKKGLGLAIRALAELRAAEGFPAGSSDGPRLVMAGGYDCRLRENVEHLSELQEEAESLGVGRAVRFLPSFSDPQRAALLASCRAVLYTPVNEHFGIVPLEAMAAGRPVVACNSGGPRETVGGSRGGLLCDPTPAAFASAMSSLLERYAAAAMGRAARERAAGSFSRRAFGERLLRVVTEAAATADGRVLQMSPLPGS